MHSEIKVYTSSGELRFKPNNIEYNGEYMGESFVTIDFRSSVPINFEIGDWLSYRGDVFTLNVVPTCKKQASKETSGEAFVYEKVKFSSYSDELTRCTFKDVVPADNEIHWTGMATFSFFCESVRDLAERIQANLDFVYGEETWSVIVDDSYTEKKEVTISVSDNTVWDALQMVYDNFKANFIIRGRKITIGTSGSALGQVFRYGLENGLKSIERVADDSQLVITRLRAYGNTNNLPTNYYKYISMYTQKLSILLHGYIARPINVMTLTFCYDALQDKRSYAGLVNVSGLDFLIEGVTKIKAESTCCIGMRYTSIEGEERTVYGFPFYEEHPENYAAYMGNENGRFTISLLIQDTTTKKDFKEASQANNSSVRIEPILFGTGLNMSYMLQKYPDFINSELYPNNMAVTNLMLPGFPTEKGERELDGGYKLVYSNSDVYIDSPNVEKYGVREGSVYIDGSDNEITDADVYPSMIDMKAEELTAAGYSLDLPDGDNGNLDEIADAKAITDNGDAVDSTLVGSVAYIWLKDIGFNPRLYALTGETIRIHMKSGMCAGREFDLTNVVEDSTSGHLRYKLTIQRAQDELGYYYPNNPFNIKAGDKFVLLGIRMPDVYIKAASERLLKYALLYLKYNDYTRFSYTPEVDNIFVARQYDKATDKEDTIYWKIHEGDLFIFDESADLGIRGSLFISNLTITENGDNNVPQISVTLEDRKSAGTISRMQSAISEVLSSSGGGGGLSISEVETIVQDTGSRLFVSKVDDDEASGLITFKSGLMTNSGATKAIDTDLSDVAADGLVEYLYNSQ